MIYRTIALLLLLVAGVGCRSVDSGREPVSIDFQKGFSSNQSFTLVINNGEIIVDGPLLETDEVLDHAATVSFFTDSRMLHVKMEVFAKGVDYPPCTLSIDLRKGRQIGLSNRNGKVYVSYQGVEPFIYD